MSTTIYQVSTEVVPLPGSQMPGDVSGGFVDCFVAAGHIIEAITRAKRELEADEYEVVDIDACLRIDLAEWEPPEEDYPTRAELTELLDSADILFGPFYCYEDDEGDEA